MKFAILTILSATLCLLTNGDLLDEKLICDSVEESTCIISTDREIADSIDIYPANLDPPADDVEDITFDKFQIAAGTKMRCYNEFCTIKIRGFDTVVVDGILEGPDILIEVSNIVRVPFGGLIHGNGLGYSVTEGPGGGTRSSYCSSSFGAGGYGGHGGSKCSSPNSSRLHYGSAAFPADFGSGGACFTTSYGGGKLQINSDNQIIVSGALQENALSSTYTSGAGGFGSGGSILLVANEIIGSGNIEAQGGSCHASDSCASGGGGRIAIHSNSRSPDNVISAAAGNSPNCDASKGVDGTIYIACFSSECSNGGILDTDDCKCQCPGNWGGPSCEMCEISCPIGANPSSDCSKCICPFGWTGTFCDECDSEVYCGGKGMCYFNETGAQECNCELNWFRDDCSVYCERTETCSNGGLCTDDGTCVCADDKTGIDCQCDRVDCGSTSVCSNKGSCFDGTCTCERDYFGCNCEAFCSRSSTCSNHGDCSPSSGTCVCDKGFFGEDCSEFDAERYCQDGDTISGYPCLLGLDDVLGHGFDIVNGKMTKPIFEHRYTEGRIFTHNLIGTFEIPDDVDCFESSVDSYSRSSGTYTKSYQYRETLADEYGIGFGSFKRGFFIGSSEYQYYRDFVFREDRFTSEQKRVFGLYRCTIRTFDSIYTPQVQDMLTTLNNDELVDNLGTHVIEEAEFGGFISIKATMSSCVLATLVKVDIEAEVNFAFAYVASGQNYISSCDVVNKYFEFESEVGGGDKRILESSDVDETNYERAWQESIEKAPTATTKSLYPLEKLQTFKDMDMGDSIDSYVDVVIPEELEITDKQELCFLSNTCLIPDPDLSVGTMTTDETSHRVLLFLIALMLVRN